MYLNGVSLNIMSLGGIALAVGMLVDNSIVVLENIYRKREQGEAILRPRRATARREVATAVFAATLTTIAVFFPDGLHFGCRRPAVPRPGADRHVRTDLLADRRTDADPDARRTRHRQPLRCTGRSIFAHDPARASRGRWFTRVVERPSSAGSWACSRYVVHRSACARIIGYSWAAAVANELAASKAGLYRASRSRPSTPPCCAGR